MKATYTGLYAGDHDKRFWLVHLDRDGNRHIKWTGKTLKGAEAHRARMNFPQKYLIIDRETGAEL